MKNLTPVRIAAALCLFLLPLTAGFTQTGPLTRAEASDYLETSLYKDVMDFISELQLLTPHVRVEMMGRSAEGRPIPLLIIGDPLPASPADLRLDGRLPVYFQANIHAGEVEGKEAVLMLIRDILLAEKRPYLDNIVLLVAPLFNADGNEKLGHNRGDNGPELAGIRYNGMNLDLNRDGMKQESPELAALTLNVLNRWDPAVMVDCHTTNGSYHEEPVTYVWPLNPNGDMGIIEYMRSTMLPEIDKNLGKKYKTLSIPYGNFMSWDDPEKGWSPAGPEPRYLTNYIGLRNRMAILLENYSHADFRTRVRGNYHFLRSVLDFCDQHHATIDAVLKNADETTIRRGVSPGPADSIAISFSQNILGDNITILGYEMEEFTDQRGRQRTRPSERKRAYSVPLYHDWTKNACVARPAAYLISCPDPSVLQNLLQHGIIVETLTDTVTLTVESFEVQSLNPGDTPFQGHYINNIKGTSQMEEVRFAAGTYFITTAQPLGNLVTELLEPRGGDGLVAWNFFDRYLSRQWGRQATKAPVYKLYSPVNLAKQAVNCY
ncbi:hypothetical protein JXO52_12920 [bacterium]|nr:hypothetical protein [bacterium]